MKWMLKVLLVAAPLLKMTTYPISVKSCQGQTLIAEVQGGTYMIELFNIDGLTRKGQQYVCDRLWEGETVEMRIDRYGNVKDAITAWIYVDGSLLQKELIERGEARIRIRNPEYEHYEELMEASLPAGGRLDSESAKPREYDRQRAHRFLLWNAFGVSVLCVFSVLSHYLKKRKNCKM